MPSLFDLLPQDQLQAAPQNPATPPDWWNRGVQGVAQGIGNIISFPRRAMEQGVTSEEAIPWSVNTMLNMAGGATPFAARGAAGIFGGRLAADNLAKQGIDQPLFALKMADYMSANGAGKDDIYQITSKMLENTPYAGVHKGADGKLRFEIPDNLATVQPGAGKAPDIVQHPDLFAAYPQLKDYPMTAEIGQRQGMHSNGQINIAGRNANELASTAVHELSHPIQELEGFARGGNPNQLFPLAQQLGASDPKLAAYQAYRRIAGEVEPRNAQARLALSPARRRATPPWTTQDVPIDQQIVRRGFDPSRMPFLP